MELKKIDLNPASGIITFAGISGNTYTVHESLSVARYVKALVFEKNIQYAKPVEQSAADLNKAIEHLNKMQFVDASVLLVNLRDGITHLLQERSFVMLTCALFCNTENEDIGIVNMDKLNSKVADWAQYDFQDFFLLVARIIPGCFRIYNEVAQTIMQEMPAMDDLALGT